MEKSANGTEPTNRDEVQVVLCPPKISKTT